MLRLSYSYPNNNVEFISNIIKYIDSIYNNYYWYITDLNIIANDREDYLNNKPVFSERVFNFQKQVEDEKGVYIKTDRLLEILFESRAIMMGVLICFNDDVPKTKKYIPSVEDDINRVITTNAMLEIRILDGDLVFIISNDSNVLNSIKEQFNEYLCETEYKTF